MRIFKIVSFLAIWIPEASLAQVPPYQLVNRFCKCEEFYFDSPKGTYKLKDISESKSDTEIRVYYNSVQYAESILVLQSTKGVSSGNLYIRKNAFMDWPVRPDSVKQVHEWQMYPYRKFPIRSAVADSLMNEMSVVDVYNLKTKLGFRPPELGMGAAQHQIETKKASTIHRFLFDDLLFLTEEMIKKNSLQDYKVLYDVIHSYLKTYKQEYRDVIENK